MFTKYVEENLNWLRTETRTLDLLVSAYLTENFSDAICKIRQRTEGGYKNRRQDKLNTFSEMFSRGGDYRRYVRGFNWHL